MAVITISSELGSDGLVIARQVAEVLRYEFVDKHIYDGIFRQYGLTKFDDLYNSAPSLLDLLNADNLLLVSMSNEILEAVSKRGNVVIFGRAGFAVLAGYADVLHVHIQAPFAVRAQRVVAQEALPDRTAAETRVRDDDEQHQTYVQRLYNKQWNAPSNFDLVLDTGALAADVAVQQIVAAVQTLEQRAAAPDAAATSTIAVDPVLADAVAAALADPLPPLPEAAR